MEIFYVRFGKLPPLNQSMNYSTEVPEPGVSVLEATWGPDGKIRLLTPTDLSRADDYGCSLANVASDRRAYLITGDLLPQTGSDGEPLLANPYLGDDITELLVPGSKATPWELTKHKLKRDPSDWKEPVFDDWCKIEILDHPPVRTLQYLHVAGTRNTGRREWYTPFSAVGRALPKPDRILYPSIPVVDGLEFTVKIHDQFGHFIIRTTPPTQKYITFDEQKVTIAENERHQIYLVAKTEMDIDLLWQLRNVSSKYDIEPRVLITETRMERAERAYQLIDYVGRVKVESSIKDPTKAIPGLRKMQFEYAHIGAGRDKIEFIPKDPNRVKDDREGFYLAPMKPATITCRVGRWDYVVRISSANNQRGFKLKPAEPNAKLLRFGFL